MPRITREYASDAARELGDVFDNLEVEIERLEGEIEELTEENQRLRDEMAEMEKARTKE